MKTPLTCIAAAVALTLAVGDGAHAAPAENAPIAGVAGEANGVWLGLVSKRLPKLVAEHLGLAPGNGLVVEMVVPDSPAAKAGLQKDDVITKLGDQKLVLPEQLPLLLQGHKPGEVITLEVLRDQKPVNIEATLAARPAGYARNPQPKDDAANDDEDPMLADAGIQDLLGGIAGGDIQDMQKRVERLRRHVEKMQGGMAQGMAQGMANGHVNMQVFRLDQGKVQINDGDGSISIEKKDGKMTLTAKDKDGKLMFEGPYATDEDKARVPEEIRKRAGRFKFEDGAMRLEQMFPLPPGVDVPAAPDVPGIDGDVKPGEKAD